MNLGMLFLRAQEVAAEEVASGAGTRTTMRLLDLPPAWIIVLVILPIFALIAWIGYAREAIPSAGRFVLAGMRFAAFALLFLVLSRPVSVERREQVHPAEVVLLVDDSASMRRSDAYAGDADTREALMEVAGADPADKMRFELVRSAVASELLPELEAGDYEVRLQAFSETQRSVSSLDELDGRGTATYIGDAVGRVLAANRGRNLTSVVVLSDGRSNGGLPVLDAANAAATTGIPIHTVVVGDTRPERNAVIELVEVPPSVLEGDEIEVSLRVLGRGTERDESAAVILEEFESSDESVEPRIVAEDEIALSEDGERLILVAPPAPIDEERTERRFRVSVPPLAGETMTDDNTITFTVHVSRQKVRVLYVDGYPRWEYRYLKNLLLRSDENFEVQCFLLSATQGFPQEHSADLEPLQAVPTSRRELLDNYDVIILGDVPFAVSPDPEKSKEFRTSLREFVEGGGGLLFQAGEFNNPRAYQGTSLEDLLPVVMPTSGVRIFDVDSKREHRPRLENPMAPHEIARLHADPEVNRRLWEDEDGLRGFYWYFPVERAKPGSQVLLSHPTATNNFGNHPLLVTGYFPAGRTMFLALDSTWMWRFHWGDRYHERFWRNTIRWLSLGRLRSGDRRYRLETPRTQFDLYERVALEARVLDEDFQPSERETQAVRVSGPDGRVRDEDLAAVRDRQGLYRGSIEFEQPGRYRAWIEVDGRRVSSAEFEVVLPSRENADPSPDPDALRSLAAITGGRHVDLANLEELHSGFPGDEERREPISSKLDEAWDRWLTMILALAFLSVEWILRKRWELV